MIDVTALPDVVAAKVAKLPVGHALDLRTYKRNRSVVIVKMSETELAFVEDGFEKQTFTEPANKLRKVLKTLIKREFPRSTKVRLYQLGPYEPGAAKAPRKTI